MADDGTLEKPEFGIPPPQRQSGPRRREKPFEYEKILDMVRERPGEYAKIATFTINQQEGRGRKETLSKLQGARTKVWNWLLLAYPLEAWLVMTRKTPDTWGDRELWVCFLGEMTPEEALKIRQIREAAWSAKPPHTKETRLRARSILIDWQNRRRADLAG